MKRRNIEELKNKSATELTQAAYEAREKIRALRLDLIAGKVKNVRELREAKKNIARMLTFAKQKSK